MRVSSRVLVAICGTSLGVAILAAVVFVVVLASRPPESGGPISNDAFDKQLDPKTDPSTIAVVGITDSNGLAVDRASISISLHNGDGQAVWRLHRPVGSDGLFFVKREDLPALPNVLAGVIAAEAPNYLAEKIDVRFGEQQVTQSPGGGAAANPASAGVGSTQKQIVISPDHIHLQLTHFNPWLTLLVLLPAIFGLILAILHLTQFSRGMTVTYWYAVGTVALWSLVATALVYRNVKGDDLIPLFWSDLFVSSGVIIFAFLGSIVYVAFSMYEKGASSRFFDSGDKERRKVLLTVGGRLLIAPYVAMTAYGIFASTFPTIRTGPFAAFFGFFTGLWIKPVLEALNDIGTRFLSAESAQKVADRMKSTEVADAKQPPTSIATDMKPDQAFMDAVAEARQELLRKENVIGVVPGFKFSDPTSGTATRAIIVYVYEKQESPDDANRVPETFRRFPTDVIALPPAGPETTCHTMMSTLSWPKIHDDNMKRVRSMDPTPQTPTAIQVENTQIVLVVDPDEYLFNKKNPANEYTIFDVMGAHEIVRPLLKNRFGFVSFAIDQDSGLSSGDREIPDYHVPVLSEIEGTNYGKEGNPGSTIQSGDWGSDQLRACLVRARKSNFSYYRYYHELGHYWCAYVTFKKTGQASDDSFELLAINEAVQGRYHWNLALEDNPSPVKNSTIIYKPRGNGEFEERFTSDEIGQFKYSQLDLYLMGLIPKSGVGPIRILRNLEQTTRLTDDGNRVFTATPFEVTIDDIILSCGTRRPASQVPPTFKQAMVVVSKDMTSGKHFAIELEKFRKDYEKDFHQATSLKGTLDTAIS